jgi:type 1 fimbria pilin
MLKKMMMFAGLLGGSALFSGQAIAADDWGPCTPSSTHVYNATINQSVTDVSKNISGATYEDFYQWNLGSAYIMSCECPTDTQQVAPGLFKAEVPLSYLTTVNGKKYYTLNNNIAIASDVLISGGYGQYVGTPFSDVSNLSSNRTACPENPNSTQPIWGSGGKGHVSLYIIHPFVGEQIIPNIKILDLFATRKKGVYGSIPASSVYISGSIIVPQGCELSTGSTLEIPFGEFQAHDFKDRKGQMPTGAASITKELQFKCTNISDGVKIFLHIEGTPNENDSNAISMGNPDIGAIIKGQGGNVLIPNSVAFEQEMSMSELVDDTHRVASTKLTFEPISTTGKMPTTGDYEGIATLRIDVE